MLKLKKCVGKENLQRLNYLYQIGNNYAKNNSRLKSLLSIYYSNLMVSVSKKTVQRMEPTIKRNICKLCKSVFVPGKNCTIRIRRRKLQYTCNICNYRKIFDTQQEHLLWIDHAESISDILNYSQNKLCILK